MGATDVEPGQGQGRCGCTQMFVVSMMIACGILGFRFGLHWSVLHAIGGALLGILLSGPVSGILLAITVGIALLLGKFWRK